MNDGIQSLMRRYTWDNVSSKSVAYHNVLPGMWSFKCKSKTDWTIKKFKVLYCVRGDVQKRLSPEPLISYSPVVYWDIVRLMFIFQCTIGLHSQTIGFANAFSRADIPSGEPFLIELPIYLKSDGGKRDVVLKLKKGLYGQAKAARLWYQRL